MDETFDREKVVDCMFDPITSSILAELEDSEKECSFLAQQASIIRVFGNEFTFYQIR